MNGNVRVSASNLTKLCAALFVKVGATQQGAEMVASNLVRANLQGVDSHGVARVARYVTQCEQGVIQPGAEIRTVCDTGPLLRVVAGNEFGQIVLGKVLAIACERAKQYGTVSVFVGDCNHIGQLGWSTRTVAEDHGLAIFMTANVNGVPRVAPFGGYSPRMGTNPLSIAIPNLPGERAVVIDFAACQVVEGKTNLAHKSGTTLAPGLLVNQAGEPTTIPGVVYEANPGAILPLGGMLTGQKGSALSVGIDLWAGLLSMSGWAQPGRPLGRNGISFTIVDPIALGITREELASQAAAHREWITSASPVPGTAAVLYPGDVEVACETERLRDGIPISRAIWDELAEVARRRGVTLCSTA